jgi:hypothetical protein
MTHDPNVPRDREPSPGPDPEADGNTIAPLPGEPGIPNVATRHRTVMSPSGVDGGAVGGARWDDWRTGCPLLTGGAASRPMCQLAWRSGCSAADRKATSNGASAADVPPREPKASDWRGGRAAAST